MNVPHLEPGATAVPDAAPLGPAVRPRSRRRATLLVGGVVAVLAVFSVAALTLGPVWRGGRASAADSSPSATPRPTAEVVLTDLVDARVLRGAVHHTAPATFAGTGDGMVTALPEAGAVVERGQQLLRVDDRPVVLLLGDTPLFRVLDAEVPEGGAAPRGNDVRVLVENLIALGYDVGRPAERALTAAAATPAGDGGETLSRNRAAVDGTARADASAHVAYTARVAQAVRRWQQDLGLDPTGIVDPALVVVRPAPVVVEQVLVQSGTPVAADLLTLASEARVVSVDVAAGELGGLAVGTAVTLDSGDGRESTGTITQVAAGGTSDATGAPGSTVVIAADDPSVLDGAAEVDVTVTADTRIGVLAVPVVALLALSGGGYGLELADGHLVAVTTGMFANGLVEVSGADLTAGTRVVTP